MENEEVVTKELASSDKKCPTCASELSFDPKTKKLKCCRSLLKTSRTYYRQFLLVIENKMMFLLHYLSAGGGDVDVVAVAELLIVDCPGFLGEQKLLPRGDDE